MNTSLSTGMQKMDYTGAVASVIVIVIVVVDDAVIVVVDDVVIVIVAMRPIKSRPSTA